MSEEVETEEDGADRRAKDDRRNFTSSTNESNETTDEYFIAKDRRKTPERRLNNIRVEETEIVEEEFFEYLESYNKQKR